MLISLLCAYSVTLDLLISCFFSPLVSPTTLRRIPLMYNPYTKIIDNNLFQHINYGSQSLYLKPCNTESSKTLWHMLCTSQTGAFILVSVKFVLFCFSLIHWFISFCVLWLILLYSLSPLYKHFVSFKIFFFSFFFYIFWTEC